MIRSNTIKLMAVAAMAALTFAACNDSNDPTDDPGQDPSEQEPGDKDDHENPNDPENPDDPEVPEVVLKGNSFQRGDAGVPVELNSAIYEIDEDGKYTFYFSNQSGIKRVSEMLALHPDDYMTVGGVTPDAENPQTSYRVVQGNLTVTETTQFDEQSVRVALGAESVKLEVRFRSNDAGAAAGNFYALYDGRCAESDYPAVANAYASGREEPTAIASVVEERDPNTELYTYYIYGADGPEPAVVITIPASQLNAKYSDNDIFTLADGVSAEFKGVGLTGGANTYGGVSVANYSDATLKGVARTIALTYRNTESNTYYRLNYTGTVHATYVSADRAAWGDETVAEPKLFAYTDHTTLRTYFILGNGEADDLAALNRNGEEGAWTVWFSVMTDDANRGGTYKPSADGFGLESKAYLYGSYETVNVGQDATLTINPNPNGEGNEYYFNFAGSFNGTPCTFEYYGAPVAATIADGKTLTNVLAPVKPSSGALHVYNTSRTEDRGWEENVFTPFDTPSFEREIFEMYVEKTDNMIIESTRVNGNCYVFYMRLRFKTASGGYYSEENLGDRAWTPRLVVPESALGQKLDLTTDAPDNSSYWMFEYNAKYDFSPVFDKWYTSGNGSRVPTKGSVTVVQNDDKTFNLSLYLYDYVAGLLSPGNQKTLVIELRDFKGLRYNSANNLLTEEDL